MLTVRSECESGVYSDSESEVESIENDSIVVSLK